MVFDAMNGEQWDQRFIKIRIWLSSFSFRKMSHSTCTPPTRSSQEPSIHTHITYIERSKSKRCKINRGFSLIINMLTGIFPICILLFLDQQRNFSRSTEKTRSRSYLLSSSFDEVKFSSSAQESVQAAVLKISYDGTHFNGWSSANDGKAIWVRKSLINANI